jgi:hypothetical protein
MFKRSYAMYIHACKVDLDFFFFFFFVCLLRGGVVGLNVSTPTSTLSILPFYSSDLSFYGFIPRKSERQQNNKAIDIENIQPTVQKQE